MTVKELMERLEELPMDVPVVSDGKEISEIVVREEIFFSEDYKYKDGTIVKVY